MMIMDEVEDLIDLIGKKLTAVKQDGDIFGFISDDGSEVWLSVKGDCCSTAWVETITVIPGCIGSTIRGATQTDLGKLEDEGYEHIQAYDFRLQTDRGEVSVEFRNSSNGFYGGYIVKSRKPLTAKDVE